MPSAVLGAAGGVLMFGTNYIPVRRSETHDGIMFSWCMGNGALGVGLLARALVGGEVLAMGLLGGAIWALSNALVLPVVKLLGLGVGFALYHGVNLVVGYLVGRLGLFGAPVDTPSRPLLADAAVLLLLCSLALMVRVEPDMSSDGKAVACLPSSVRASGSAGSAAASTPAAAGFPHDVEVGNAQSPPPDLRQALLASPRTSAPSDGVLRADSAPSLVLVADPSPRRAAPGNFVAMSYSLSTLVDERSVAPGLALERQAQPRSWRAERLQKLTGSDGLRKLTGVALALAAGLLAGVNTVPFLLWKQQAPNERALNFLFANLLGVYAAASAIYVFAGVLQWARGVHYPHSPVRPAYLSGALWAVGCGGQLQAIDNLGMSTAYVLCAIGPVMVSALASALIFGEIRGAANWNNFLCALALQIVGVVMLGLGA